MDSTLKQEKRINPVGAGPAGGARSIRFVAASQLPVSPIDWLVADYLEQNTLAVLYGAPGKGTLISRGLVRCDWPHVFLPLTL